jgi:selenocysteine-specific elongation factor
MHVIGTAGHVDHGKTTLVEALTGINPDRLKEERERQMTIDLGFAWLTLPNGESVGVIDVPGHRDFIENMLAGVGGIDAALFVVAADEGVMPQTREHLAILDLLQIPAGVIALTKADLVEAEWRELVAADVAAAVRGTVLEGAPLLPVSARSGEGLPQLKDALQSLLSARPARPDLGRPRLPIDRIFTLSGFGTVVTGTLTGGALALGDEVEILPAGLRTRVRGLQTHKTKIERAVPGSRVAVNLSGVEIGQLRRGMVVSHPGVFRPTSFIDARFQHLPGAATGRAEASLSKIPLAGREGARGLPDAGLPLKHNAEVKFFVGAAEVLATVRLLEGDSLLPGASGWVQLALAEPVVAAKGDRFILRRPSPGATIGGGVVVDPQPKRRHRRMDPAVVAQLETLAKGTPGEILLQALEAAGPAFLKDAVQMAGLTRETAAEAVAELQASGELIQLDPPMLPPLPAGHREAPEAAPSASPPGGFARGRGAGSLDGDALVVTRAGWGKFESDLRAALAAYHSTHPLRAGMPREELKSRLSQTLEAERRGRQSPKVFNALVARASEAGAVVADGAVVRLPAHRVKFSPAQQTKVEALLADFRRDPHNTPSFKDCAARVDDEVLAALVEQGALTQVSPEVLFLTETYTALVEKIRIHLRARGKITVAEVRDLFSTSRKYALALMEHLDAQGITRRVGDERVLRG